MREFTPGLFGGGRGASAGVMGESVVPMVVYARQPVRAPLSVSLALSLLVHVSLVGGTAGVLAARGFLQQYFPNLFASAEDRKKPVAATQAERPEETKSPEDPNVVWVRPGIDDGASDSMAWIGYASATEHTAYESSVDQSAMTTEPPGMLGEEELPSNATPEVAASVSSIPLVETPAPASPAETSDAAAQPVQTQAAPTQVTPTPPVRPAPVEQEKPEPASPPPLPSQPAPPEASALTRIPAEEKEAAPVKEAARPAEPDAAPEQAKEPDPRVAHGPERPDRARPEASAEAKESEKEPPAPEAAGPPAPQAPASPSATQPAAETRPPAPSSQDQKPSPARPEARPAGSPGDTSDKEADATSIKQALEYRNGRVRAGEGIDIKTVKPEFSNFTVLTALPKVPVVEITFNAQGKVKNVRMVQSSGYKDVDEPILNAVWAWTAKGKKLEAMSRENPRALLKLSVRMLL